MVIWNVIIKFDVSGLKRWKKTVKVKAIFLIHVELPNAGMDLERNNKRKACDYDSHIESVSIVNGEGHEGT